MPLNPGTLLGRYEIRSHLGSGGMGEVYLAHDTQLERMVALKILPQEFAADHGRMQRFVQEARAASALNHPNIITIHEIGSSDATHFIATEFIDGETLRQRMRTSRLSLIESLDVALQTAGALTAAHQAGVIHRDIKPENIMVRKDGYVKVLDFGLAKPTERAGVSVDSEAATRMLVNTSPGMIMGTVSYMSPEQTRGQELDERTDIWSVGVSLYEMLTGRVPFSGDTPSDVIVSVLDREPAPLYENSYEEVPDELQRIVRKSLRKDKEERYQTIRDMLVDLRALKQDLEFEAKLGRNSGGARISGEVRTSSGQSRAVTDREVAVETEAVIAARQTAGTEQTTSTRKGFSPVALSLLLISIFIGAVLAVGGAGYLVYKLFRDTSANERTSRFQAMKVSRLTSTGRSIDASISPDGKYVAHVFSDGGQRSLWIRQVASSRNVELVAPADSVYVGTTFTPDSSHVFYVRGERNQPTRSLFQVSVLGGEPRKILYDIDSPVEFSPDGKRIAFMRVIPGEARETHLMIANADGTGQQKIASRPAPDGWWFPVWSPDGKTIACTAYSSMSDWKVTVVEVNIADGSQRPLTSQTWREAGQLAWLRDGSGLMLLAPAEEALESSQIWFINYADGEARRVTNDLNTYVALSVAADSGTVATVQAERVSNLWISPAGDADRSSQVVNESSWLYGVSWAPDGRIVYSSNASGRADIWIVNADGSGQKQLTDNAGMNLYPNVSPDGRSILFVSDRGDSGAHVYKMDIDGGHLKQLTFGRYEHLPQITPDGQSVVYNSATTGKPTLWKIPIEGGDPVQLTNKYSKMPVISPDGKMIACYYWEETPSSTFSIALIPIEGGTPIKTLPIPTAAVKWSPDGRALLYVETRGGISNLMSQPIDGSAAKKITDWKSERIFDFAWSPDGKQLALARGVITNDVVLMNDARMSER